MENKLKNIRTWLIWSSVSLAITDLIVQAPNNKIRDNLGKIVFLIQAASNLVVLATIYYSFKKNKMEFMHMALNLSNLRFVIAPCVTMSPEVGVNYKERYLLKMVMCALVTTW